ncbi:MAG TPA: PAS domain-containing sensor histidine kinase [Acetobacteraceae bacterium]|nr:PAS domain-containing sensor histidine kinase [Acetobacteraceae bacterium]
MNVTPSPEQLRPAPVPPPLPGPPRSWPRRLADALLGKVTTLVLTGIALAVGLSSFLIIARGASPNGVAPVGLVLANLTSMLLLGAVLAGRLTRVWAERRRGYAGSRLHVRMVMLFSGIAVAPTIVVACFAVAFFHVSIQTWFNDPVREAVTDSLQVSRGYLEEHRDNIRAVALEMAADINRAGVLLATAPGAFGDVLATQTTLRGLTEAVIYDPYSNQVIASAGLFSGLGVSPPPQSDTDAALKGDVVVMNGGDGTSVRAIVELDSTPPLMLMIGRPVDPSILAYMKRTEAAVAQYKRLDDNRSWLQVAFVWIFAIVALLVLLAAALIGLVIANQIARPIGSLINAAERVRGGELGTRVAEIATGDEVAGLSRAFNRMTGQLAAQRAELMDAYRQIDERRRFTETVLSGVSAGVIGLDAQGRIELPNRAADELLGRDLVAAIGRPLAEEVPEFAPLIAEVAAAPERARTAEVQIGSPNRRRTLLTRIGADLSGGRTDGFVLTFDDITELQAAQRKAAWADVARRIAHEIKNPLTPIQLAAERLKRRFAKEIQSDPDTFGQCADTIIRHVGDIGRMVDEFSAFARMPQPVIKPEDVGQIAREALVLQKTARPHITWHSDIPQRGPLAPCDRRLIRQALVNLLQNAADAVSMREGAGTIDLTVQQDGDDVRISVTDDGIGLPPDRVRLTEPYVTHKPKGTGLGLAIVKKILEDHHGSLALDDRSGGPSTNPGAVATLILPLLSPDRGPGQTADRGPGQTPEQDQSPGLSPAQATF